MASIYEEFLNQSLHRSYPLTDSSTGHDTSGVFTLSNALIADMFLCAPNLPQIDITKFYIQRVIVRTKVIDIFIGYDGLTEPLGRFKNIATGAALNTTYQFIPSELQTNDLYTPLYYMTGQVIIGDTDESVQSLGSWTFLPAETTILSTRVSQGVTNVQYIEINNRLFTGNVRLKEGSNITMDVDEQVISGETVTFITFNASLAADSDLQLVNDADILNSLTDAFGEPLKTINGLFPDADRNFDFVAVDCTRVTSLTHGIIIENPCARPCCDEDDNVTLILESIANLNQRYAQIVSFYEGSIATVNDLQNKLLSLGSNIA